MSIVSNSSPLILLAKIGRFNLLRDLFEIVYIPKSVYHEVVIVGAGKAGSKEVEEGVKSGWIKVEIVQISPELELILGRGEAEAITLAEKLNTEIEKLVKAGTRIDKDTLRRLL